MLWHCWFGHMTGKNRRHYHCKALNSLLCADVPLRNYSLTCCAELYCLLQWSYMHSHIGTRACWFTFLNVYFWMPVKLGSVWLFLFAYMCVFFCEFGYLYLVHLTACAWRLDTEMIQYMSSVILNSTLCCVVYACSTELCLINWSLQNKLCHS